MSETSNIGNKFKERHPRALHKVSDFLCRVPFAAVFREVLYPHFLGSPLSSRNILCGFAPPMTKSPGFPQSWGEASCGSWKVGLFTAFNPLFQLHLFQ